jgi:hypothetical protein
VTSGAKVWCCGRTARVGSERTQRNRGSTFYPTAGQNRRSTDGQVPGGAIAPASPVACNKASLLLDKVATADAAAVMQQVITKAKAGDLDACSLLLARLWPARRGRPVHFDLPHIAKASDVTAALGAINGSAWRR